MLILLLGMTNGNSIEFVVSACREPASRFDEFRRLADGLRAELPGSTFSAVRSRVYCKCGMFPWCTHELDNVGREGHTFLTHIASRYDDLADVTFFSNGGTGDTAAWLARWKARALTIIMNGIKQAIARRSLSNTYWGDEYAAIGSGKWANATTTATSANAFSRRLASCRAHLRVKCAQGSGSRCTIQKRDDQLQLSGLCSQNTTRCECDAPSECYWLGRTSTNSVADRRGVLAPAQPGAFAHWACERFAILPDAWHACSWAPFGMFAVGSARIRAHARAEYERAAEELAAAGVNGGVAVHFLERSYKSIFVCSLQDIGLDDPIVHGYKRPR
jgi:hypothetical protein